MGSSGESMTRCLTAAYLLVTLAAAAPAASQGMLDCQLRGTVRDPSGAVIVDAAVVIASPRLIGGPRTTETGPDGQWRVSALPTGDYTVNVSATGFKAGVHAGLALAAGSTLHGAP